MLFELLIGHAIADFALQSDVMAKGKNRNNIAVPPKGQTFVPCWGYWLTAHALVNGGLVYIVVGVLTGNYSLAVAVGLIETIFHWYADFFKCDNKTNPHQDQMIHICCKLSYCLMLWRI